MNVLAPLPVALKDRIASKMHIVCFIFGLSLSPDTGFYSRCRNNSRHPGHMVRFIQNRQLGPQFRQDFRDSLFSL